ncbi:glycosyltransferase family protein [Mycoplasmoides alvi]|uniref:hypothetical protein n=1 Tax=Mycoplasmoides alvi TaxID=78580 RepID=UPI00051BE485|nr:hypothetical protein [Mycoplasmoides alvi]
MKKILIINSKPHFELGGMETYSKKLIQIFLDAGHEVYELSHIPSRNIQNVKNNKYHFIYHDYFNKSKLNYKNYSFFIKYLKLTIIGFKVNKLANKWIKKENINIVIDNNFATKITFIKNVKYIWVQHFDWNLILGKDIFTNLIKKFLNIKKRIFFPNIVTFTTKDKHYLLDKKLISNKNIYPIASGVVSSTHTQASAMKLHSLVDWIINKKIFNF